MAQQPGTKVEENSSEVAQTDELQASASSQSVPFPHIQDSEGKGGIQSPNPDSHLSEASTQLTSSDKLSALPTRYSPTLKHTSRTTPSRVLRRSLNASGSLPSFTDSPIPAQIPFSPSGVSRRGTVSEGSTGSGGGWHTPRLQRVSFESDMASLPAAHSLRHALASRVSRASETSNASPATRGLGDAILATNRDSLEPPQHNSTRPESPASPSPSRSHSRHASPLRFLWPGLYRIQSREEPFIPVDPFQLKSRLNVIRHAHLHEYPRDDEGEASSREYYCDDALTCSCLPLPCTSPDSKFNSYVSTTQIFVTDTLPRFSYLYFLLRLPSLYFSRVARIFEDAEVSRPDIERMIDASGFRVPENRRNERDNGYGERDQASVNGRPQAQRRNSARNSGHGKNLGGMPFPEDWNPPAVSPALARFKHSWEEFVDSLVKEWKTLNIVSALLVTAILTMFQIDAAASDPVTRTAALISLVCGIMSLVYGCVFIVRFGTMRSMYRASRWAEEAQMSKTAILWNVWVMLAMPAVWLAWAMITFIVSILSFVWRTGSISDPEDREPLSPVGALGPRIAVTAVFGLGLIYFLMIVRTFRRYGHQPRWDQVNGRARKDENITAGSRTRRNKTSRKDREKERERAERERGRERGRNETAASYGSPGNASAVTGLGLDLGLGEVVSLSEKKGAQSAVSAWGKAGAETAQEEVIFNEKERVGAERVEVRSAPETRAASPGL